MLPLHQASLASGRQSSKSVTLCDFIYAFSPTLLAYYRSSEGIVKYEAYVYPTGSNTIPPRRETVFLTK